MMIGFALRRLFSAIPVLVFVTLLAYGVQLLMPGDAATAIAGAAATAEEISRIREQLEIDQTALERLLSWYGDLLHGNLGNSILLNRPVSEAFLERLPVTALLACNAVILAVIAGLFLGVIAAIKQNKWQDWLIMTIAVSGIAIPNFWLGLVLILIFAVELGWATAGGLVASEHGGVDWIATLVLPTIALALAQVGLLARVTRSSILEVLRQDYVRTARAKGLPEFFVIGKHCLRNALIPIVTVAGIIFSRSLGGAVVIEQVFALPGVGRLTMMAIFNHDYAVIQAALLLAGALFVFINLCVDILASLIDPRIRCDR